LPENFGASKANSAIAVGARSDAARAALLMTTAPTAMSCRSRRRALKKLTNSMNGESTLTLTQYTIAWTAPRTK
jgi:hypothetical protein